MPFGRATRPSLNRHGSRLFVSPLLSPGLTQFDKALFWLEVIMKKFFVRSVVAFALVFAVSVPVLADTIRLKDGSVIRGQIISFKNEQFTILVGSGARGRKSQITVYMEDVESIDFDSNGNSSARVEDNNNSQTTYQPPYQQPTNQP